MEEEDEEQEEESGEGASQGEDEEGEDAEDGLKIAWQYRKSIQDQRLGHVKSRMSARPMNSSVVFCHSFDLSGRLLEQDFNRDCIHVIDGGFSDNELEWQAHKMGFQLFHTLKGYIKAMPGGKLVRLLLYKAPIEITSIALPLLLAHIRSEELPVVIMVTIQSWMSQSKSALISLQRMSDVVMQVQGFASRLTYPQPPEFQHLHGLLMLPKVSVATGAAALVYVPVACCSPITDCPAYDGTLQRTFAAQVAQEVPYCRMLLMQLSWWRRSAESSSRTARESTASL